MVFATRIALGATLALAVSAAVAQVEVKDPWVRATVPGQMATGMFARITAPADSKLVSASSPLAGIVEIHEMAVEGGVMKMRAMPALALPAGRSVELKPGGYHVMLMDLKQTMKAGDTVPVTLVVQTGDKRESIQVAAPVRPLTTAAPKHAH